VRRGKVHIPSGLKYPSGNLTAPAGSNQRVMEVTKWLKALGVKSRSSGGAASA
jgi:hypothetical protein